MKSKITLAVLALVGTAGASSAMAQSAVTIYGRLNVSVERQKLGNVSKYAEQDSNSRFGFRGVEDLGGGLFAGFQLESAINTDTGTSNGTFWNRGSEVNLGSKTAGMVRLGRLTAASYYATADFVSNHNHDTGTSADALYAGFQRTNNTVAYRAPELVPGLRLEVATSLSEGAAPFRKTYDFAANYAAGPLALGFGYDTYGIAGKQFAVRGYYTIGDFGFGGYVQRDTDTFGVNTGSRTNVRLSGMYTMGGSEFHLNYGSAGKIGNIANSKASQGTVAYNYNLSKRTKVYAFYTKLGGEGNFRYTPNVGVNSSFAVGVRHNF